MLRRTRIDASKTFVLDFSAGSLRFDIIIALSENIAFNTTTILPTAEDRSSISSPPLCNEVCLLLFLPNMALSQFEFPLPEVMLLCPSETSTAIHPYSISCINEQRNNFEIVNDVIEISMNHHFYVDISQTIK